MRRNISYKLSFLAIIVSGLFFAIASFAEQTDALPQTVQTLTSQTPATPVIPVSTVPKSAEERIWNLQDADILSVINEVSEETGKTFVVDPRVNGKITLISSKPIKRNEVYQVFLNVLGMLGYSAIESGKVVKIVPNMESGEQTTAVATNLHPGKGEEVVVRVVHLENVSSTQLIPILRPLLPQWSNISAYAPGNVLILLGRASNLERLVSIIQDVDKAANSGIQMIRLYHASAAQVATVLNNLQNAARASGESPGVSIAVDERSNSVLLSGPKAMRIRMRILISQLDAPTTNSGNTEVVYLRYLEAKKFVPIISKIAQNIAGKDSGGNFGGASYSSSMNAGGNSASISASSKPTVSDSIIQAEPTTNSLIITAPPSLMIAIKAVIAKLDVRPAEVLVEAIIAQVDESNLRNLGIQWGSVGPGGSVKLGGEGPTPTDFPSLGAGVIGLIPGGHRDIRAVLSILENLSGVDILSTPSIVVLDNQKAMIEVGQDVPYQTGQYTTPTAANPNNTVQPFATTSAKPVTLRLEVTPQINLSCSVRLQIKLKNDTLQNPANPTLTPIINTSKIENSVIVQSDDILVLGGLISNENKENINKVPILGDFPIIGPLFRQVSRTVAKRNLMVFIKPIIMQNNEETAELTHVKYNYIRRKQVNFRDDLEYIGKERAPTILPPWKCTKDLPTPFATRKSCPNGVC